MRLRLLRFTTLFCRRLSACLTSLTSSSLADIRAKRRRRLKIISLDQDISIILENEAFAAFDESSPIPPNLIDRHRASVPTASGIIADSSNYYGKSDSFSLLDALFSFMALSAAFTQLRNSQITRPWMLLTAQYMLAAVLEQFLAYGSAGREVIAEAFAYGFPNRPSKKDGLEVDEDELLIKKMFWKGEDDEAENDEKGGWRQIRNAHINIVCKSETNNVYPSEFCDQLVPPEGTTLLEHLENVEAKDFPIHTLQLAVHDFLQHLLQAQPQPLLLQVEQWSIDRLSAEQTEALLQMVVAK